MMRPVRRGLDPRVVRGVWRGIKSPILIIVSVFYLLSSILFIMTDTANAVPFALLGMALTSVLPVLIAMPFKGVLVRLRGKLATF